MSAIVNLDVPERFFRLHWPTVERNAVALMRDRPMSGVNVTPIVPLGGLDLKAEPPKVVQVVQFLVTRKTFHEAGRFHHLEYHVTLNPACLATVDAWLEKYRDTSDADLLWRPSLCQSPA